MICWCGLCYSYMSEMYPYDDYSIFHGICSKCRGKVASGDRSQFTQRSLKLTQFFNEVRSYHQDQTKTTPAEILAKSRELEIQPLDLLMGIMQPALYELGRRWLTGHVTVAQEHWYTERCTSLVELTWKLFADKARYRRSEEPLVLISNAVGNSHILGVQILELILTAKEIPNHVLYPGMAPSELLPLIRALKPKYVGISVSLATQVSSANKLGELVEALPQRERPELILGGFAVKTGLKPDPSWRIDHFKDALHFIEKIEQTTCNTKPHP